MSASTKEETTLSAAGGKDQVPSDGRLWGRQGLHSLGRLLSHIAVLGAIIAVWHFLVVVAEIVPSILVPPPSDVGEAFASQVVSVVTGGFVRQHFIATVAESWAGFAICVLLGVVLGLLISEIRLARRYLMPYVILFNATPRVAFAPIFLIWFGFGWQPKIVMAVAIATFPVLIGTLAGLAATESDLLRLMRAYGATRWQMFVKARVYVALPYIVAGAKTASVFAVVGAVVGEFAGGAEGLGFLILVFQESLNIAAAFAAILLLSLSGMALYLGVVFLGRRLAYWADEEEVGVGLGLG